MPSVQLFATCLGDLAFPQAVADAETLLRQAGYEVEFPARCCGFGGTCSVRQPGVSVAMADDKLAGGAEAGTIVTADPGCLMHLRGRAEKVGSPVRVVHLATALARGVGG